MAGRALVFSHPRVVETLKKHFVPYAGDKWYLNRQQDEEGRFFRKVAGQEEGPQGVYAATPDGENLRQDHFHPSPERFLALLDDALKAWKARRPTGSLAALSERADPQFARTPPKNGLIVKVYSRIPSATGGNWTPNHATGRDHLWLTEAEWRSLLPSRWQDGHSYSVPRPIAERIARFHLVDNVRGEPDFWSRGEVKESDLRLVVENAAARRLRLEGAARMKDRGARGERGYEARLQGYLTADPSGRKLTGFDVLAWGEAWGEGRYTGGAPKGRFPLVIATTLSDGKGGTDRVPPQGSRHLPDYLGR